MSAVASTVAGADVSGADVSYDPRSGRSRGEVAHTPAQDVADRLAEAALAAPIVSATAPAQRSAWLAAIADALEEHQEELAALGDEETALGMERLRGEVGRAAAQARFYAAVAVEGGWLDAAIDALPDGTDLRRIRLPLGPIAVFGASNFPLAFGVCGHDTTSAIAAGCPVLVKAHPAHPRLSVRLGSLALEALAAQGAPTGAFALVVGFDAGLQLVDAPEVRAVAFTGSQRGGMAIAARAAGRPVPVPVYAEMGTVNPVVVTPAAARARLDQVLEGFAGSFTLGQGQFCTKPGLLLAPRGDDAAHRLATTVQQGTPGWLLTEGIAQAYADGVQRLRGAGASVVVAAGRGAQGYVAAATVLSADASDLVPGSPLLAECFGPVALVVEYEDLDQVESLLAGLQPSLAAAIATSGPEDPDTADLVARLAGQVGRVVVDGWPTGVPTTWAQQHGGPWPATSRPDATSVGAAALDRFTRPVAFQDVPDVALPAGLRQANPWAVPRRVNGRQVLAGAATRAGS